MPSACTQGASKVHGTSGRRTARVDSGSAFALTQANVFAYKQRSEVVEALMRNGQSEYEFDPIGNCYAPNCDRIFCRILRRRGYAGQVVLVGFYPSCPHSDRKKSPNCRALVVGLRR